MKPSPVRKNIANNAKMRVLRGNPGFENKKQRNDTLLSC